MKVKENNLNWNFIADRDLPSKRLSSRLFKKHKNYFFIPSTKQVGEVNALGKNCLAVYALLTTAQAMHPREQWHTLPNHQLHDTGLDRYKIYRAMTKLEAAGVVEADPQPGRKTRYRLIT